jgi:hypothetical protein
MQKEDRRKEETTPHKKHFNDPWKKEKGETEDLPMLQLEGQRMGMKTFVEFKKRMINYATRNLGDTHCIIEFNEDSTFLKKKPKKEKDTDAEMYRADIVEYSRRVRKYEEDKTKLYGVLEGQMSLAFMSKVERHPGYEDTNREKDPLRLWKIICEIATGSSEGESTNPEKRRFDATRNFDKVFQTYSEDLNQFQRRFIEEVKIFEAAGGSLIPGEALTEVIPEETEIVKKQRLTIEREKALAMTFICKLDKKRYGDLLDSWEAQLNDGYDVYPKTLADAFLRAGNHKIPRSKGPTISGTAFIHTKKNCDYCNKTNHNTDECFALKKAKKFLEGAKVNLTSLQELVLNAKLQDKDLLLDNQATISIFKNGDLLTEIHECRPITINGIGGSLVVNKKGKYHDLDVYYNQHAPANILCFFDVNNSYGVTIENGVFTTSIKGEKMTFKPEGKLYVHHVLITTEKENKSHYTQTEINRASEVHRLFIAMQRPGVQSFRDFVSKLELCPFSNDDIDRWLNIYGPDHGSIMGRMTRRKNKKVKVREAIKFQDPTKMENANLAVDLMFIEKLDFFVSIDRETKLITVKVIPDKSAKVMETAVTELIGAYKVHRRIIRSINCDGEKGIKCISSFLSNQGIDYQPNAKGDHVADVERAIRQIKERVRSTMGTLPYEVTDTILAYLVRDCVRCINLFPRKGENESPIVKFRKDKLIYSKDLLLPFGQTVFVHEENEITNSMIPRSQLAINLGRERDGTRTFLTIPKFTIVERRSYKEIPVTEEVIKLIKERADQEKIKPPKVEIKNTTEEPVEIVMMSVKKAQLEYGEKATLAVQKEMQQLHDKNVFTPVYPDNVDKSKILRSMMIVTEKRDGRVKARFVAMGSDQDIDKNIWSSPTAGSETILVTALIDAYENKYVATADIEGAYLHAHLNTDEEIYLILDKETTAILVKMFPELQKYVSSDGTLIIKLLKALYGLVQSAKLFNVNIMNYIEENGFVPNKYDHCILNKGKITIRIFVDDLLISGPNKKSVDGIMKILKDKYKQITEHHGNVLEYLGMEMRFQNKSLTLSLKNMIQKLLDSTGTVSSVSTPAIQMSEGEEQKSEPLKSDEAKFFHSIVATLLYIAKKCRPDILHSTVKLCQKVKNPTINDNKALKRILQYLHGTKNIELNLEIDDPHQFSVMVDSAFAINENGKSQTGYGFKFKKGYFFCTSRSQSVVAKSSTVAELIAMSEAADDVMFLRQFLEEQNYKQKETKIYEDNKSTITLIKDQRHINQKTRYLNAKYFSMKELHQKGEIALEYLPSMEMVADFWTKPLVGKRFFLFRDLIMNWQGGEKYSEEEEKEENG